MISVLKEVELEYIRCFSKEKLKKNHIEFFDDNFRDTFISNIAVFNKNVQNEDIINTVNKNIILYKQGRKSFLNFEVHGKLEKDIINNFITRPVRMDRLIYMITKNIPLEHKDNNVVIKEANSKEILKDFININLKDCVPILGERYAKRKIKRKIQVYKDLSNKLTPIVFYKDNIPIGSCEILISNNICKIEDVLILKKYRKCGFGRDAMRKILNENYEKGIEYTYLIAEAKGSALKFYEKLGFQYAGEKTQIIWDRIF